MTSSATRPPWLYEEQELEKLIEAHNPSLNLSELRRSRNGCQLVNNVLNQMLSKQDINPPGDWEMNLARIHLAVDLQNILKRWCGIGLQRTLEGSALRELFSSEDISDFRRSINQEPRARVTKVEFTSPPRQISVPGPEERHSRIQDGVKSCDSAAGYYVNASLRDLSTTSQASDSSIVISRPSKRPLEDADQFQETKKAAKTDKSPFVCPYYVRNPHTHVECAQKCFPNPRKLKEHVWRFLKPFKCPTCGEGFGREKTRAIHCDQRKTKCTKAPSSYEGSLDQLRDRRIETAKSTQEMIEIFVEYEKGKDLELSQSRNPGSTPVGDSLRCPAEERSPSPESQNGSPNNGVDSAFDNELDSGVDEDQLPERSCSVSSNSENPYTSQQLQGGLRELQLDMRLFNEFQGNSGRHGQGFNQAVWGQQAGAGQNSYATFLRGKSDPPLAPAPFQPHGFPGLPEIVVSEFEVDFSPRNETSTNCSMATDTPQNMYHNNQYCYQSPERAEDSYTDISMGDETRSQGSFTTEVRGSRPEMTMPSGRPDNHDTTRGVFFSPGYGSMRAFTFNMRGARNN